ncbi:MAG: saccharopine dehydrogenase NADP-binding domain-containing protein, partial [Caldimonas sp.]
VALEGRRILVVGAGGATAGVLGPLLAARPAQLVVANRTPQRAVELLRTHRAAAAANQAGRIELRAAALADCGAGFDVVINATSSSMLDAEVPVSEHVLAPGALAIDLMYGTAARTFLAWAEARGATARDGLGMLVEQAAVAFELFRGVAPDTAPVHAALRRRIAETGA